MKLLLLSTLILFCNLAHSAQFNAGTKSVGIKLSGASIGHESYTIAGVSINYFVIDNLAIGGAYEYWFSGKPSVSKTTLESTYFLPTSKAVRPYLGLLYSHYYIADNANIDAYGYRAGISYIKSPLLLSVGIRQEEYSSDRVIFTGNDVTGEFIIGFSF